MKSLTEEQASAIHSGISALTALITNGRDLQESGSAVEAYNYAEILDVWEKERDVLVAMLDWREDPPKDRRMRDTTYSLKCLDVFTWEATAVSPDLEPIVATGRRPWNAVATADEELRRLYAEDRLRCKELREADS